MAATTMTARELLTKVFQGEQVSLAHAFRPVGVRALTVSPSRSPHVGGQTLTPELLSCENDFATHLMRYPDDTNFVAARKPGVNYGCVPLFVNVNLRR